MLQDDFIRGLVARWKMRIGMQLGMQQGLGLDFAQYDLDRLVANLVLVKTPELGYTTAIKEPGLAALESYCLTRSRSHQVFVRHHKVAQVGSALRYTSTKLMADPASESSFQFPIGAKDRWQ